MYYTKKKRLKGGKETNDCHSFAESKRLRKHEDITSFKQQTKISEYGSWGWFIVWGLDVEELRKKEGGNVERSNSKRSEH